jgi:hypothetical protein
VNGANNLAPLGKDNFTKREENDAAVVSRQQNSSLAGNCRCGNCQACAARAYSIQGNDISNPPSPNQAEITRPAGLQSENEKENADLTSSGQRGADGEPLTREEIARLAELKKRDRVVRAHEQAHMAAAAGLVRRGMSLSYQKGPDGRRYAVAGEVQIDASKESTPSETIVKMKKVRAAALAPVDPSSQDRRVAAGAMAKMSQARMELQIEQMEKAEEQRKVPDEKTSAADDSRKIDTTANVSGDDSAQQGILPTEEMPTPGKQRFSAYTRSLNTSLHTSQFHLKA